MRQANTFHQLYYEQSHTPRLAWHLASLLNSCATTSLMNALRNEKSTAAGVGPGVRGEHSMHKLAALRLGARSRPFHPPMGLLNTVIRSKSASKASQWCWMYASMILASHLLSSR